MSQNMGLHVKPSSNFNLSRFADANWATNSIDRKSIAGYYVYLGDTLVFWSAKKQKVVSRSSSESKYRALANTAAEISWLRSLLKELEVPCDVPVL